MHKDELQPSISHLQFLKYIDCRVIHEVSCPVLWSEGGSTDRCATQRKLESVAGRHWMLQGSWLSDSFSVCGVCKARERIPSACQQVFGGTQQTDARL